MPKARRPTYLEEAERLEVRRAKVRLNVQSFRRREKEKERAAKEAATANGRIPCDRALVWIVDTPYRIANSSCIPQPIRSELSGTAFDKTVDRNVDKKSPEFSLGNSLAPISQVDFIVNALQHRYLPDGPIPIAFSYTRIAQFCSTWVATQAVSNTAEARLLRSVLFTSALSIVGLETHDTRLLTRGYQAQTVAFRNMRSALDSLAMGKGQLDANMLAITILFCASSELTINKSWENFWKHMHGVGALVERGGPSSLSSSSARDLFYSYRVLQMPFGFMQRRAHFFAQHQWIGLAWRKNKVLSNDYMQTMLDIAYQIPVEMQDYDEHRSRSPKDLRERLERLRGLAVQLEQWKADMDMSCTSTPYRITPATWPGVFTEIIEFEDLTVAMPFNSSCGVRVHLFDLIRQIAEDLSKYVECHDSAQVILKAAISECLKWSRAACQCMEFVEAQKSKFKVSLISLFPFDAAWDTFSRFSKVYGMDLRQEVRWCQNVASKYDARGLPVLCWR